MKTEVYEEERSILMRRLIKIQNTPKNWNQDIVTFSAFLDNEQLAAHVERYESYARA